jgi:transcriptional antiterminator
MLRTVIDRNGKHHDIKIDDDMAWLEPYLMEAGKTGIPIWRVEKIVGYYVPKNKTEAQYAQTSKRIGKKSKRTAIKATITLLKKRQVLIAKQNNGIKVVGYEDTDRGHHFESTLNSLAHELSHLIIWKHTADRFILESKLMVRFAKLAKKKGYKGFNGVT